jgi:hypothetical protein
MPDLLALDAGATYASAEVFQYPALRDDVVVLDMYELPTTDLGSYVGMLVPNGVDQELLYRQRGQIRQFLDDGKVLVFCGHLFRDWLPGGQPFVPKRITSTERVIPSGIHTSDEYNVCVVTPHPVFDGVSPEDLTFRRGVRGFFARGHHPLPPGAEVLLALQSGEPVDYVDRASSGGTILVHAGNDLVGYLSGDDTAQRVAPQLLRWMHDEYAALQQRRVVA